MKIYSGPLALPRSIKLSFIYNPITLFELFLVIKIVIFNMKVRGESWLQITSPFVFLSTEVARKAQTVTMTGDTVPVLPMLR